MQLNQLGLTPALIQQRQEWLELIGELNQRITRVEGELSQLALADERCERLRTHPGIGILTSLALVHTLCPVSRFANSRKVTAFVGLDPREYSSGEKQRMGRISKHGSRLLRFLLVEAAKFLRRGVAVRSAPTVRRPQVPVTLNGYTAHHESDNACPAN